MVDCRGGFIKTRTDFLGLRANILRLALAAFICPGLLAQSAHDAGELPEISEARALEISRELANRRAGIEEVQSNIGSMTNPSSRLIQTLPGCMKKSVITRTLPPFFSTLSKLLE